METFGVPFEHVPEHARDIRPQAEARLAELLDGRADVVVLARYMQIVSPELVAAWPNRIINIHHSFLPAFVGRGPVPAGARPRREDRRRDGALRDRGARRRARSSSRTSGACRTATAVEDLKRLGRELERRVLARAVRWHCEDRVIVHGNKTVVFD